MCGKPSAFGKICDACYAPEFVYGDANLPMSTAQLKALADCTPKVLPYEVRHVLRNLDSLSVENLKCGRITRNALREAMTRIEYHKRLRDEGAHGSIEHQLADELSDMLEMGRKISGE